MQNLTYIETNDRLILGVKATFSWKISEEEVAKNKVSSVRIVYTIRTLGKKIKKRRDFMRFYEQRDTLLREHYLERLQGMPDYVSQYVEYLQVQKMTDNTISAYLKDLDIFFYYICTSESYPDITAKKQITLSFLESLTPQDIQSFLAYTTSYIDSNGYQRENNIKGIRDKLTSLRAFYSYFCFLTKRIKNDPAAAFKMPKKKKEKEVVALNREEISELLNIIEEPTQVSAHQAAYLKKTQYRDYAIIVLFLGTGLRVSELVGIELSDINWRKKEIHVHRKGDYNSSVNFNNFVEGALRDYIEYERKPLNDDEVGLFLSGKGERLSVRSIQKIVKKYTDQLGHKDRITPHKLRSSYASLLYEETKNPILVQQALDHSNLITVQKYIKRDKDGKKKSADISENWLT